MAGEQPPDQLADDLSELNAQVHQQLTQVDEKLHEFGSGIEEHAVVEVKERLSRLETAINKIPSPNPPPKTTLQLQSRADVEEAWQNYLHYFLNPEAHHGLGKEALIQFLRGINAVADEEFPTRLSDDVVVRSEVSSPNDNRPDIVIEEPRKFFICCELKLYSSEGSNQTNRYYADNYIGTTLKSQFPKEGHHYVYLRRPDSPGPDCDEFVNITWKQVREWFEPLLLNDHGRYSSRTTAQLADFTDTIQQDMTQDEHIQTAQEKMELYFKHQDAIQEAQRGLETAYEYEVENWRRRFIEGYLPENWNEDWHTDPRRYGQIYHSKWRQDEGLEVDNSKIELHFVHLIRDKESFTNGKLTFQLRMSSGRRYRDRMEELFMSERFADTVDPALGEYDIDKGPGIDKNIPRFTGKTYSVVSSDLPGSYYETLQQATREHIEITPVINEILETAIDEVEAEL